MAEQDGPISRCQSATSDAAVTLFSVAIADVTAQEAVAAHEFFTAQDRVFFFDNGTSCSALKLHFSTLPAFDEPLREF